MLRRLSLVLATSSFAAGCGLVSDNFDAELKVDFQVQAQDNNTYRNVLTVDPSEYPDVRDNCSSVEKSTGQIRSLTLEVVSIMNDNRANFGSGYVWMRHPDGPPIDERPESAFASFEDVPLQVGQVITLDMTPARRAQLAELVFTENCDKPVELTLIGETDQGPVFFDGRATFFLDFVASL